MLYDFVFQCQIYSDILWLSCLAFSGCVTLRHLFKISGAVGRRCCIVSMHPGSDLRIKAMARKLFSFFTGASADVKVAFDESVRQDLIRSMPFVNMSYGTLVSLYRPLVSMYPTILRGTDIALKTLNIISTMEFLDRERYSSRNCCDKYFFRYF